MLRKTLRVLDGDGHWKNCFFLSSKQRCIESIILSTAKQWSRSCCFKSRGCIFFSPFCCYKTLIKPRERSELLSYMLQILAKTYLKLPRSFKNLQHTQVLSFLFFWLLRIILVWKKWSHLQLRLFLFLSDKTHQRKTQRKTHKIKNEFWPKNLHKKESFRHWFPSSYFLFF